jgi:SAM-dependent methyltransferase
VRPLLLDGLRIDMVTIADPQALAPHDQLVADGLVSELEAQARRALRCGNEHFSGLESPERYPSLPHLLALRGSALALHPLFEPSADRLAHGFSFDDLQTPRFDGRSALDALRALLGPARAGIVIDRVRAFCDAAMSAEARLLTAGSIDARGLRQRALITARTVAARRERWSDDARIAAVGAAAGDAVARIAAGFRSPSLTLFDRDPLALAAAVAVLGPAVRPVLVERDAPARLAGAAGAGFDVVDLTGALDTRPDAAAVELLCSARQALRPGGVVVASNMLAARPQQTFFEHVVRWPGTIQRSPAQLARLLAAAGLPGEQVSLAIPATAPVHVIATIDTAA